MQARQHLTFCRPFNCRWGKAALTRASPTLTSLLLLWLLAIYVATALQHYFDVVPQVRAAAAGSYAAAHEPAVGPHCST